MTRPLGPSLVLLLSACTAGPAAPVAEHAGIVLDAPIPPDARFAPERVIVGFADEAARPEALDAALPAGAVRARLERTLLGARAALYRVPADADVVEFVDALRATGRYRFVEPDYERKALVNDPYRSYQWHLDAVNAESAWAWSTGAGAVVAVIDTGVTSGPYDGIGALTSGWDFVNGDSDASDDNGHGTHVAGTIAQATDNGSGVAGLAYDATIMPVKVLDASGSGYTSDVVDGISWAASHGADVINLSLGSSWYSSAEATAVYDAWSAGVFVAAAAGNSGARSVDYPAAYTGAVAVGATRYGNARAWYSNRGTALDLVAPGGDTSRDDNGDGYADGILQETFDPTWGYYFFQGTSMAAPHVAAAAALLMAQGATNAEAESLLESTALDLGRSGWDSDYGWGLVQPDAALAAWAGSSGGGTDTGSGGGTGGGDTGTPPADTGTSPADTGVADTGTPPAACTVVINKAEYDKKKGKLKVEAWCSDDTATLEVWADGSEAGAMTYNSKKDVYKLDTKWPTTPSGVEVTSSCGGSDTSSVKVKGK